MAEKTVSSFSAARTTRVSNNWESIIEKLTGNSCTKQEMVSSIVSWDVERLRHSYRNSDYRGVLPESLLGFFTGPSNTALLKLVLNPAILSGNGIVIVAFVVTYKRKSMSIGQSMEMLQYCSTREQKKVSRREFRPNNEPLMIVAGKTAGSESRPTRV
ncbi:MAG: hypothetical protein P8182_17965 [Deltaproteobacteria bacterium]